MKSKKGIFITGTDTGVGKTYVARLIAGELRRQGLDVGVMKPAETGCAARSGSMVPSDALLLMKAACSHDSLDLVNPYRFPKPLAPAVAASIAGKKISPGKIISAFRKLSSRHDITLVEGAGGIMVPLTGAYCYLDLAADLGLPVLIVARPGLGTVNHTLLTIAVLRKRGLEIAGVVMNHGTPGKTGMAEKTNPGLIKKLSGVEILGIVRHGSRREENLAVKLMQEKHAGSGSPRRTGIDKARRC